MNILNIEGPLGKKSLNIDLDVFKLDIKEGKEISIKPIKINQDSKRLWGIRFGKVARKYGRKM